MIADVQAKAKRNFEIRCAGDPDNPDDIKLTFHFTATCLSWTFTPSPSAKNAISFGVKISGGIEVELVA
jgi:hypothetical protein